MDDFIQYLLVTGELDEVFWGKDKDKNEEDNLVLKRTLNKEKEEE